VSQSPNFFLNDTDILCRMKEVEDPHCIRRVQIGTALQPDGSILDGADTRPSLSDEHAGEWYQAPLARPSSPRSLLTLLGSFLATRESLAPGRAIDDYTASSRCSASLLSSGGFDSIGSADCMRRRAMRVRSGKSQRRERCPFRSFPHSLRASSTRQKGICACA